MSDGPVEKPMLDVNMWWAYVHANGTVILKRWFGDPKDYSEDCVGNPFVLRVCRPFHAATREEALAHAMEAFQDVKAPNTKEYLGDSVYAQIEEGQLVLTTENDTGVRSNTIVIEPFVFAALKRWVARHWNE